MFGGRKLMNVRASKRVSDSPQAVGRRFGTIVFIVWAVTTALVSFHIAHFPYLCRLYGFSHVRAEHLHFIATPKGAPWIVSNGDQIKEGFSHYLISAGIWFALFVATFPFIYRLLPVQKKNQLPGSEPHT